MNRLIKIYHSNGKYGFSDPVPENSLYTSVQGLIKHYTMNSLAEYNPSLNTTLKYPIARSKVRLSFSDITIP